jgi:outer membrane autotransporter protein
VLTLAGTAGTNITDLTLSGSGNLKFTGAQTFTGNIIGTSGTEVLDVDADVTIAGIVGKTLAIDVGNVATTKTLTLSGATAANITTLTLASATAVLDITGAKTFTGNVASGTDGFGIVAINADVSWVGQIGDSDSNGTGNLKIASGKTLTLTSATDADGVYIKGKMDLDAAGARGGTVTLVGEKDGTLHGQTGTTQISLVDGTTKLTALNTTGGAAGLSATNGTAGSTGGSSVATLTGAADISTVTLAAGASTAGKANHATTAGGVGGAVTGTFTAALTATSVNVYGADAGAGGAAGTTAAGSDGGVGAISTLDLNVATATAQAITTLTIRGGAGSDGGDGENTSSDKAGGDGVAGGNALATIAGDFAGAIVLDNGTAGTAGTADGSAAGGAAGAGGTATATFDGGADQEIVGNITAAANNEGAIVMTNGSRIAADIVTITGGVGSSSASVNTLKTFSGTDLANVKVTGNVYVKTISHGLAGNYDNDLDATMDLNGNVVFTTFNISAGTSAADEDATVTVAGNMTGTTIALIDATGNGTSTLTLDGTTAQTITAAITASADALGNISVTNTAGTVTFSGAIGSASGSKAVQGVTLAASSTTVFDELVDASTLSTSGVLTINKAVTLASTLTTATTSTITLGTAFKNGGSIAITAADSTGAGKLNQTAGAVTVNLSNQFTTGTVTLLENTAVLDATDLAAFSVTDTALVDYTAALKSDDLSKLDITASKRTTAGIASYLGMSSSQTAALGQVTAALASGDATASAAIDTVLVSGGATAVNAVEQLNPDAGAATGSALAAVSGVNNVISSRQTNTRVAFNALGSQSGISTGDHADDLVVWAQIFGSSATQDKVGTVDGYDADSSGLALGWESVKSGDLMGLSVSYSDADVDGKSASASHTDTTAVQVSAYGTYGKATDWMVGYASGDNDTKRTVNFGGLSLVASGKYDSDIFTAKVGHAFPSSNSGDWTMTPKIDASYTNIDNDGYTETGANNLNLIVGSSSNDILTARAGAEFTQRIVEGDAVTIPHFNIMAGYDLKNDGGETSSTFTGGGSAFTTKGADPEKASLQLGFGVDHVSDDSTVSFDLNADLRNDYDSMSGSLTFKSKF